MNYSRAKNLLMTVTFAIILLTAMFVLTYNMFSELATVQPNILKILSK